MNRWTKNRGGPASRAQRASDRKPLAGGGRRIASRYRAQRASDRKPLAGGGMTRHTARGGSLTSVLMVIGAAVVLVGVIIGWFTIAGSGIHHRPYGRDRVHGESPLDSPWQMGDWSRGTQGRRRRS